MAKSFIEKHWRKLVGAGGAILLGVALKGGKKEDDDFDYEDEEFLDDITEENDQPVESTETPEEE